MVQLRSFSGAGRGQLRAQLEHAMGLLNAAHLLAGRSRTVVGSPVKLALVSCNGGSYSSGDVIRWR